MKIHNRVTLKSPNNDNVVKLSLLILIDENNDHWLLPFKPELDIVKPGKKNKELFEIDKAIAYNIQKWMDDDSIDETINQLILGSNLYKMDSRLIEGEITLKVLMSPSIGDFRIDIDQDINPPFLIKNYSIHAAYTNHHQRKVL